MIVQLMLVGPMLLQDRALQLPKEHEMEAKDKYTTFSASARGYRKSVHKVGLRVGLTRGNGHEGD